MQGSPCRPPISAPIGQLRRPAGNLPTRDLSFPMKALANRAALLFRTAEPQQRLAPATGRLELFAHLSDLLTRLLDQPFRRVLGLLRLPEEWVLFHGPHNAAQTN
jgi:hypothetical protein